MQQLTVPDNFNNAPNPLISPVYTKGLAVIPSDATYLPEITRGLWVGGAGDVNVQMSGMNNTTLFKSVPAGTLLPIRVGQVLATSTTATNIVAMV